MNDFPVDDLERLAKHILEGETVFFIGAGFSLDSESNSAGRLIARLLARFDAMTAHLASLGGGIAKDAADLRETVKVTFKLESGAILSTANVSTLVNDYYQINDWICNAFSCLLTNIHQRIDGKKLCKIISKKENALFKAFAWYDDVPLDPIDLDRLAALDCHKQGKALFLDTMGFVNPQIMGGNPEQTDMDEVLTSYQHLLKPRHHILARWAREGFCSTLITTNYDLLLEGAYRLSGFLPDKAPFNDEAFDQPFGLSPTTFDRFSTIAGPSDFFKRGSGHQSALIVKIHGCVAKYRRCRDHDVSTEQNAWQSYLPSMVFTYREIQNWREDSWSRDYLCTLLRTRKMVFNCYSLIDPVLHDTVRSVYEEIASQRALAPNLQANEESAALPAFYMGISGTKEFHGLEILRAASRSVGEESPSLTSHNNYLQFHLADKDSAPFPLLDEKMRWLFHRTYRLRQAQVLKSNLRRITTMIMGHPCTTREIRQLNDNFDALVKAELGRAKTWTIERKCRAEFNAITHWTEHFHLKLLREFALAETLQHQGGLSRSLQSLRKTPWYFPILDNPDWAAWSIVVELALRRMVSYWQGDFEQWLKPSPQLVAAQSDYPQVHFSKSRQQPTPRCLTIRLGGFERTGQQSQSHGAFNCHVNWDLYAKSIPWFEKGHQNEVIQTPNASELWRWASCKDQPQNDITTLKTIGLYLGEQP